MAPDTPIHRARLEDAAAIAAVHIEVWRNAYPGLLPDRSLTALSQTRLTAFYAAAILRRSGVMVARDAAGDGAIRVVGFTTASPRGLGASPRGLGASPRGLGASPRGLGAARRGLAGAPRVPGSPAEGEVETLYVLDDWRERGIGRSLLKAAARHLAAASCQSMYLWVLADNPSRWFYERLGGQARMHGTTRIGGTTLPQIAMVWEQIDVLAGSP